MTNLYQMNQYNEQLCPKCLIEKEKQNIPTVFLRRENIRVEEIQKNYILIAINVIFFIIIFFNINSIHGK